jgi:hypothetical protein
MALAETEVERSAIQPSNPVTQICSLRFADGEVAQGQITATSAYQECSVIYTGQSERLPALYPAANSVLLRALFRSFARDLRVEFSEEQIGRWADESDPSRVGGITD